MGENDEESEKNEELLLDLSKAGFAAFPTFVTGFGAADPGRTGLSG